MHPSLLILFVKTPVPGQVKTRLAAQIGHPAALAVYEALLTHLGQVAAAVQADKVVFYGNHIPEADRWSAAGYPRVLQAGDDIGTRMAAAFRWGFAQGYQHIGLVGSDIPGLSAAILQAGLDQLARHDYSLGPARDGGYYFIGMRELDEAVFAGKAWSTSQVLADTLADMAAGGGMCYLLPELSDVDEVGDLRGTFLESLIGDQKP
ncbi:MAG: TIGR04282 family arsenosugar biosynthesis glycosyltransferase [Bacteroidia bacterium]